MARIAQMTAAEEVDLLCNVATGQLLQREIAQLQAWLDSIGRLAPGVGAGPTNTKFQLPSFDLGGYVPRDMLAMVHAGELRLPAIPSGGFRGGDSNASYNSTACIRPSPLSCRAPTTPWKQRQALERSSAR